MESVQFPQGGWLPVGRQVLTGVPTDITYLVSQNAAECRLGRLMLEQGGGAQDLLLADVRFGGISFNGTNLPAPFGMFASGARFDGADYIGLPLKDRQEILVGVTNSGAGTDTAAAALYIDGISDTERPVGDVRDNLYCCPFYYGLGTLVVPAASQVSTAIINIQKRGLLGPLYIEQQPSTDVGQGRAVSLVSMTLNGLPFENGPAFQQGMTVSMMQNCDDIDGKTLGVPVEVNDQIVLTFNNPLPAIGAVLRMGCYALPQIPGT